MRLPALVLVPLLGIVAAAEAATVPYRSDGELIAIADRVVRGRVLDSTVEGGGPGEPIRTRTRLAVLEDFTGAADRIITVVELGGRLPDGRTLWIPGAPRYAAGEEVVLCLEASRAGLRTVAMGFAAFRVRTVAAGVTLERFGGTAVVGGPAGPEPTRTLAAFRQAAAAVKGTRSRLVMSEADAAAAQSTPRAVVAPFELLGDGIRWHEADEGTPIAWYRNTLQPSPLEGANTDEQIGVALSAWTAPVNASIVLTFGGTRTDVGPATQEYCTDVNLGVGLITFGDPSDTIPDGVLAIGGGCSTGFLHLVNGTFFESFTHGLVVLNDTVSIQGYTTVPNFTRILEHEIGHGIGLDHTTAGETNIMHPSCCASVTPIPPAIGADDAAGVAFIYPPLSACTFTVAPLTTSLGAIGGEATATVTASQPTCTWTAVSTVPWIIVTDVSFGVGSGTVRYAAAPNLANPAQRVGAVSIADRTVTVTQAADVDTDGDSMTDAWETFFGLDPASIAGSNGPLGDPDGDNVSNASEFAARTHPKGTVHRYLAEGVANAFFDTDVALFNPGTTPVAAWFRIQPETGTEATWPILLPPLTRRTVTSPIFKSLLGGGGSFSTLIEADGPIVVDRTVHWGAGHYGSHAETAVEAPATTWYLAEGSTAGDFELFYLLQNPGPSPTSATIRFLRPAPQPPIVRTFSIAAHARLTIPVATVAPELASTDVSGVVNATDPIIVERAMYMSRPGEPFSAGHGGAGVTAPALQWFLAEGATGSFFELFVLLANPGTTAATVRVDYLLPGGGVLTKPYTVAPQSRSTIWVDNEELPANSGQHPLASTAVSTRVTSTNGVPIIVERAMWWPQPSWYEAHAAAGTTVTGTRWALADGFVGGPASAETYILVANTAASAGTAVVTLYFEDGTSAARTYSLPGESRTNVAVGAQFPSAAGRRFSAIVESTGTSPVPVVVERAMYESPGGVTWAAGTDAVATRLTP